MHTRPFCLEHARAGAPIACRNGTPVTILKWDARGQYPIVGLSHHEDVDAPRGWNARGEHPAQHVSVLDLFMTPLGMIDGKPVFVGDKVITPTGMEWIATPDCRSAKNRALADCSWPAPAPVYPETQMTSKDLCDIAIKDGMTAVANAALRHAVEQGQVVVPGEAIAGLRPFNPYTGRRRDQRDIDSDPMGIFVCHPDEPRRATVSKDVYDQQSRDMGKAEHLLESLNWCRNSDGSWSYGGCGASPEGASIRVNSEQRAARDMAIAEAVRDACSYACVPIGGSMQMWRALGCLDLAAIVAGVKS